MHRTLSKTKSKNSGHIHRGQGLEATNKFYQVFNNIGKILAQANLSDKQKGIEKSSIQRFSY